MEDGLVSFSEGRMLRIAQQNMTVRDQVFPA